MDPRNKAVILQSVSGLQSVIFAWKLGVFFLAWNMDVVGVLGARVGGGRPGRGSRGRAGMIRVSAWVVGM
jgi:hypothetical protein